MRPAPTHGDPEVPKGTVKNRMAHLRWLARKIGKPGIVRRENASYGVGARCAT